MIRHTRFLLLFVLLVILPLFLQASDQTAQYGCDCEFMNVDDPKEYGDDFDWSEGTPFEFLEMLRNTADWGYTMWSCHEDWIKPHHLEPLIALLDSEEPCGNVASAHSSFIDTERSTVGDQAAYLILSYRAGCFPSSLNSPTDPDKQEILRWWWSLDIDAEELRFQTEHESELD